MTGFGKTAVITENKSVIVEIRTLNSKQLELNTRISPLFRDKEHEVRSLVAAELERGKIDLAIYLEKNTIATPEVNPELAKAYYDSFLNLSSYLGNKFPTDIFSHVLRMPDVLVAPKEELSEELWSLVNESIIETCRKVNIFRVQEGAFLASDLQKRIKLIESLLEEITPFEYARIERQKQKIQNALSELSPSITPDANRLEQEMIYYLEKLDITEEKVRLRKHCQFFKETLEDNTSNGKKLGFIIQECGREVNTIGSKCNDFNIQQIVVRMKDEVEKIKEQLFNIL
jgi:uncharacterized protein (TIGR00255 family)